MEAGATEPALYPWHEEPWARWRQVIAEARLPHALLFTGLPGTGKRRFARRLARAHLCSGDEAGNRPCGGCSQCRWLAAGSHPDLLVLEPEEGKTELRVDPVRELGAALTLTGTSGRRAAIVDPAHAMNRAAANAFLKTLEEPPAGVLLMLVSEQPSRLPATIRSRCQVVPFNPPPREEGLAWLAEHAGGDRDTLARSLALAGGAVGEAQRIADPACREERRAVLEDLARAARGELDPVSAAEKWQKLNLDDVLDWFARWLALAAAPSVPGRDGNQAGLGRLLEGVDSRGIFVLYDEVIRAHGALDTQLRKDLMLEELIIHWCRLAAGARSAA